MRQLRHLVITLLSVLAISASAFDVDSLKHELSSRTLLPIEGIWRMTPDGATIAIVATPGKFDTYDVVLVDSPDMSLDTGIVCGTVAATASPTRYSGRLAVNPKALLRKTTTCVIELASPGRFTINPYNSKPRLSFWRWIPYFFRVTTVEPPKQPSDLYGAIRIFPATPGTKYTVL